ncbi:ras-related and estrogen-regulated growth inhibitor-like [Asterias amurensis]|uniref:ras-related and estrogen-regulated growth inhibitor-like n=1 Tax=Asterias amurensis TaxID=7602 RepID=UPI003AB19AED
MSTSSPFGRRKKSGSQTEVKIAVTGVNGVGKSAVTVRFLTRRFIGEYGHEPETKYHHQCKIDGDIVLMEILDTGSEGVLTDDIIQWADGLLLVYSITDMGSVEAIRQARLVIEESRNTKSVPVAFTVVANKADLLHLRKVDTMEGERLSKEIGCSFAELSASESYDKIADVFHELYREIRMYKFGSRSTLFGRMFGHTRDKKTMTL